jgi:tRNA1Val (adenine37-N6)-methyltransferase
VPQVDAPTDPELEAREDESLDTLLRGRIRLLQSKKGYRTSVDAMALAWFACAQGPEPKRCVDLGAGSGLVSILIARHLPRATLLLIERQPDLAARALRNLRLNGLQARATLLLHDLAEALPPLPQVDLVVSNPPYYVLQGRDPPKHAERHGAHCETTAPLERFCEVAAALLLPAGVACFVYPEEGTARLVRALQQAGLVDVETCALVHREGDASAVRVLARARRGVAGVRRGPTLALHPLGARDEVYTPEIERFLQSL